MIVLFFLLYLIIFFWPVINFKAWFWEDFPLVYFPLKSVVFDNLSEGVIPLLNNYILAGNSMIADVAAGIFYPLNIFILPFWSENIARNYWILEVFTISHLLIAFIGMLWLGKKVFHFNKEARIIAALAFTMGSFLILHQKHLAMVYTSVWLPFIFGYLYLFVNKKKFIYLWWSGVFIAISALAGHLQIFYYLYLWLGSYVLWEIYLVVRDKYTFKKKVKRIMTLCGAMLFLSVVGFASGAIQFLPLLEILPYTSRMGVDYLYSASFSLDYFGFLINLILPHIFGGHTYGSSFLMDYGSYWESTNYLGLGIVWLAILSWLYIKKQKFVKFLWISIIVFFSIALGDAFFTHWLATKILWGFDWFRAPGRLIVVIQFALALVAGFTWQSLVSENKNKHIKTILDFFKKYKYLVVSSSFLITIIFYLISRNYNDNWVGWRDVIVFLLLGYLIYKIFYLWYQNKISNKSLAYFFIILLAIDLFVFGFEFNKGKVSPDDYYHQLSTDYYNYKDESRSAIIGLAVTNMGLPLHLSLLNGYHYLVVNYIEELTRGYFHGNNNYLENTDQKVLNMYNVRYLFLASKNENISQDYYGQGQVVASLLKQINNKEKVETSSFKKLENNWWENKEVLGNAWMVDQIKVISDNNHNIEYINSDLFDPKIEVVFDKEINFEQQNELLEYQISNFNRDSQGISFDVDTNKEGIVIISQSWLPGYYAYIENKNIQVFRVNHSLLGIVVPSGYSEVILKYYPLGYHYGRYISYITWSIILLVLMLYYVRMSIKYLFESKI